MARKVTDNAVKAFFEGCNFKRDNTEVTVYTFPTQVFMRLHGNCIATRCALTGKVDISLAGWPSATTRERLNGILDYLGQPRLYQHRGEQFMGDKPFPTRGFVTVREASHT